MTTLKQLLESDKSPFVRSLDEEGEGPLGYMLGDGSNHMLASLLDGITTLYDPEGNIVEQWLNDTGDEYHPEGGTYYELHVHGHYDFNSGIPMKKICVKHPKNCEKCKKSDTYEGCHESGCYNLNCAQHKVCEDCGNRGNMCACCKYCGELDLNCECSPCPWCDTQDCQDPKQCYYYGKKCDDCHRQATCWDCVCKELNR
jgi:hypothetical protein